MRHVILTALMACGGTETANDTGSEDPTPLPDDTGPRTGATDDELAISGSYTDAWGTQHEVTGATWTQTYAGYPSDVFHVTAFDNDQRWLVAENDPANTWNPGLWSRFDWHDDGAGELYFCQTAYDAVDSSAALETPAADAADLSAGCGGFGWTHLTP